jgi:hypothetical protein
METDPSRAPAEDTEKPTDDESVEDFKREMEEDPSRAPAPDDDLERQRGG